MKQQVLALVTTWMGKTVRLPDRSLSDFDLIQKLLQPGDVLLVNGRTRTAGVIQSVTVSPWSHAALYIGCLSELRDPTLAERLRSHEGVSDEEQLGLEATTEQGVVVSRISRYQQEHVRLCRPWRIDAEQVQVAVDYVLARLGREYDTRQILDMLRFFFPYDLVPRRWRSSLFGAGHGDATREVCSTLLVDAFEAAGYPVLPPQVPRNDGEQARPRNGQLRTPRDFDYSPYFDIVKYPLASEPARSSHPAYDTDKGA